MLIIQTTNKFEKEYKKAIKSGKNIKKIDSLLFKLANEEKLDKNYYNHPLRGKYKDRKECHIEPDLLLIYKKNNKHIIFERLGSHSDFFE